MFRRLRQRLARLLAAALLGNRDFYDAAMGVLHRQGIMAFAAIDRFGHLILLHPRDRTITRAILRDGAWQHDVFENFESFVQTRTAGQICFVDIGANIGSHAIYALHSDIFDEVVAVEANPELAKILQGNMAMNDTGKKHSIFNVGAHSERGSLRFSYKHRNIGGGSFRDVQGGDSETVVEVAPLVDILSDGGLIPGRTRMALWIDVEGHEADVLKGAAPIFEGSEVFICMEVTPGRLSSEEASFLEQLFSRASDMRNALDLSPISFREVFERGRQADILAYFEA